MSETVIKAEGLSKRYRIGARQPRYTLLRDVAASLPGAWRRAREAEYLWVFRDISFEVKRGDIVGIIGRNGAGKSTLLKILSRITEPTEGRVAIAGRVSSLLEVGTGFHPELTGRENVFLNGSILGMKNREIKAKFDEIVSFAEVEKFVDTPIKFYSSGMYVRLAFAVAAHLEPDILLVDEVLAVGDIAFQKKCLGKMESVAQSGRTVLFVSHNMWAVVNLCAQGILLGEGTIKARGPMQQVVDAYVYQPTDQSGVFTFPHSGGNAGDEFRFAAARIMDEGGRPVAFIDAHKKVLLEVEYDVCRPIQSLQVAFELWNAQGLCVLCTSDLDADPGKIDAVCPPGRYRALCGIPAEYLRPGQYGVKIGASVPGVRMLGEVSDSVFFTVRDAGGIEQKLAQGRRGVVLPLLPWQTQRC